MNYRFETHSGKNPQYDQRGASLLEAIAFLGIAAVVILGAVSLLGGAFSGANINKTSTEIVTLRTNITKLYVGQSSFGTDDITSALNSAKMAPGTLVWNGTNFTNAFNGTVTVTGKTTAYKVVYTKVTTDACIPIVMNQNGWTYIAVNMDTDTLPTGETAAGTSNKKATYSPTSSTRTLPDVTTACGESSNTLTFWGQ